AAFALITLQIYGTLQAPAYYRVGFELHPQFIEALLGNLVSPARGLLVFSPVVLLSFVGAVVWLRQRNVLGILLSVMVVGHWIGISGFPQWWAGWSYGPRYMSDMLPYLVVLSVPAVQWLITRRAPVLNAVVAVLVLCSLLFNADGALLDAAWRWNG